MSDFRDNFDRRIIPRWRKSTASAEDNTMQPLRPRAGVVDFSEDVQRVASELTEAPTAAIAVEALNIAILAQDKPLEMTARAILLSERALPAAVQRLIAPASSESFTGPVSTRTGDESGAGIRRLRRLLQQYPKNPLLFLDLARHHAILGNAKHAEKAAMSALALAPAHRLVLRSVARYYLNTGDEGRAKAHKLLVGAEVTRHDPWLIAAELAISQEAGRSPKYWREAKSFLERRAVPASNLSELASAVGTFEVLDGQKKRARKLFELALLAPTENTLAQVKWAEQRTTGTFALDQWMGKLPSADEAISMRAYQENDLETAARHAQLWYYDEPFSATAAITASYVCSMLDDHDAVLAMMGPALMSHPDNRCLENNYIFARISGGRLFDQDEAAAALEIDDLRLRLMSHIRERGAHTAHATANLGLLAYRCGSADEARQVYDFAVNWARDRRDWFETANALLFHARESILAQAPWAGAVLAEAEEALQRVSSAGLTFYLSKVKALAKDPHKAAEILCPSNLSGATMIKPRRPTQFEVRKDKDGLLTLILPKKT